MTGKKKVIDDALFFAKRFFNQDGGNADRERFVVLLQNFIANSLEL